MEYLKLYENFNNDDDELGFEVDDRIGEEVKIIMTDDGKYFLNPSTSGIRITGSSSKFLLQPISEMTIDFLNKQQHMATDRIINNERFSFVTADPNNNSTKEARTEYPRERLKIVKWFVGAYKM